jgi:hypothetical protein
LIDRSNGQALETVLASLTDDELRRRLVDVAREVFGASVVGTVPVGGGPPDPGLVADIDVAVQTPNVIAELRSAASALWGEPGDDWLGWIQERYLTTLGVALIDAIQTSCPDVDASNLRCDLDYETSQVDEVIGTIHISEDQPGGVGVVESFVDRYVEDPRAFWSLVTAALGPCDGERVDANLRRFLAQCDSAAIREAVTRIRSATSLADLTSAWRDLRVTMFQLGLDGDQTIVAALATRIVRPGSNRDRETLVADLLEQWDDLERSLGVEIELRVFAHVAASNADIRRRLQAAVPGQVAEPGWEIGQIVGLLWSRGNRLRAAALRSYSPYVVFQPTERLLFEDITESRGAVVDATSANWRLEVDEALRANGSATIRAENEMMSAAVIRDLLTEPTSVDVLEFHPRVIGIARSAEGLDVLIELREARQ